MKSEEPPLINRNETIKQETIWKNNLFNRYLLFRYSLAIFFFSNIYWLMIMIYKSTFYVTLPLAVLIIIILAIAEQFRLYSAKNIKLKWTKFALFSQIIANVIAIILIFSPSQYELIFPVFSDTFSGKVFISILQIFALLLIALNLKKVRDIEANHDRFYLRFQKAFIKTHL